MEDHIQNDLLIAGGKRKTRASKFIKTKKSLRNVIENQFDSLISQTLNVSGSDDLSSVSSGPSFEDTNYQLDVPLSSFLLKTTATEGNNVLNCIR